MARQAFLFIDESGDPGDNDGSGTNSRHYSELVLHVESDILERLVTHVINWRYCHGIYHEPKKIQFQQLVRFLAPLGELHQDGALQCSAVYLNKAEYTGPYLKVSSPKGQNPIRFRNFVHYQLLKFHLNRCLESDLKYDVVFDYYRMSKNAQANLELYLITISKLPGISHICHIDSRLCFALQVAGQLANTLSAALQGRIGENEMVLLDFIARKDITRDNLP